MARIHRTAARLVASIALASLSGCVVLLGGDEFTDRPQPACGLDSVELVTGGAVSRVDLLIDIDDSSNMGDKRGLLAQRIPDLIAELTNPRCVDSAGAAVATQPSGPDEPCAGGSHRLFPPIRDMHIGVITSTLGGHGSNGCSVGGDPELDDHAHLIDRGPSGVVPTYEGKGFLAWDPGNELDPPGESDVGALSGRITDLVLGGGVVGCGFESQLESWYRFLVDPEPYESLEVIDGETTPLGIDQVLLEQRKAFLRPDSLLLILMLSDENDCSVKDSGQAHFALQTSDSGMAFHLPRARAECAVDPADPCCASCFQTPDGCPPPDPGCDAPILTPEEDSFNLRCFDQKRRFGIDFLQPVDRYVTGLQSLVVPTRDGTIVANPIYSDLDPTDDNNGVRDTSLVLLTAIVGVPWQDIARRTADGTPDLVNGLDPDGNPVGGVQSAAELVELGTWAAILGSPATYEPPGDPFMRESQEPRSGENPITHDPITPPSSKELNPINGHEFSKTDGDLQLACIFPLAMPIDCAGAMGACPCTNPDNDNPLCDVAPGGERTLQTRTGALPGLRELDVIRGLGSQGILGSICPKQLDDPSLPDFGYRPAIQGVSEKLSFLGSRCLDRQLVPDAQFRVPCTVLEARHVEGGAECACDAALARLPVDPNDPRVLAALEVPGASQSDWNCFCEIVQPEYRDLVACQDKLSEPVKNDLDEEVDGWCYIDASTSPSTGNPGLVEACPEGRKRSLRFVGAGRAAPDAAVLLACDHVDPGCSDP